MFWNLQHSFPVTQNHCILGICRYFQCFSFLMCDSKVWSFRHGPFGASRGKVVTSVTQFESPTRTPFFPSKMHNFYTMSSVTEFESPMRLLLYPSKSGQWPDDIQLTTNCEHVLTWWPDVLIWSVTRWHTIDNKLCMFWHGDPTCWNEKCHGSVCRSFSKHIKLF